jgi:peptide/nickel transport system permease protein
LNWIDPFMLTILLFSWMPYARIINAMVINQKQTEYIEAAKAVGIKAKRIVFRHLLPNVISPNVVLAARDIGGLVILRSTFTYIGLTDGSPWATMLLLGKNYVIGPGGSPSTYWWVYLPISIALLLFGFGWNLLGDEVNEWLDPRAKRRPI